MRTIYQYPMMRRKIRKMISLSARWRVPAIVLRPTPLTKAERRIFYDAWRAHFSKAAQAVA